MRHRGIWNVAGRSQAAVHAAALFVAAGIVTLLNDLLPGAAHSPLIVALGIGGLAVGALAWLLPWHRWHDRATLADDAIGAQLLAVLREALSNVVRHAGASQVTVAVTVTDAHLVAKVIDDGVGAGPGERLGGKGLASLHHRAEALGGILDVREGIGGAGTAISWTVPLIQGGPAVAHGVSVAGVL